MNSKFYNRAFGKPLQLMVCAGLAVGITALTTQVIASAAGQHEYQIATTRLPPERNANDIERRITVARVR